MINAKRVIRTAACVSALAALWLSCSSSEETADARWEQRFTFPGTLTAVTALGSRNDDVVVATWSSDNVWHIYRYASQELIEEFSQAGDMMTSINGLDFAGDNGWAFGTEYDENATPKWKPWLIHYDGAAWSEVTVPASLGTDIFEGAAAPGDSCWLLSLDENQGGFRLSLYKGGAFQEFPALTDAYRIGYSREENLLFVLPDDPRDADIMVTADDGATWQAEPFNVNAYGDAIQHLLPGADGGGAYYFIAELTEDRWGVVKRTGAPGEGVYTVAFVRTSSEGFGDLKALAMSDGGRGVAVGDNAALYFDGARWNGETCPEGIVFDSAAAVPDGFWAVGSAALYFHP